MTFRKLTLFLACLLFITNCQSQITLPRNLEEAVLYFQQNIPKDKLDLFKNKPEEGAVTDLHFTAGLWIRNNWVRSGRDTALTNYFHALGIHHPDDISSIILTSLHRTLNQKDIRLNEQINWYKAYWDPIINSQKKQKTQAVENR